MTNHQQRIARNKHLNQKARMTPVITDVQNQNYNQHQIDTLLDTFENIMQRDYFAENSGKQHYVMTDHIINDNYNLHGTELMIERVVTPTIFDDEANTPIDFYKGILIDGNKKLEITGILENDA